VPLSEATCLILCGSAGHRMCYRSTKTCKSEEPADGGPAARYLPVILAGPFHRRVRSNLCKYKSRILRNLLAISHMQDEAEEATESTDLLPHRLDSDNWSPPATLRIIQTGNLPRFVSNLTRQRPHKILLCSYLGQCFPRRLRLHNC
jgi:hypothetical protein